MQMHLRLITAIRTIQKQNNICGGRGDVGCCTDKSQCKRYCDNISSIVSGMMELLMVKVEPKSTVLSVKKWWIFNILSVLKRCCGQIDTANRQFLIANTKYSVITAHLSWLAQWCFTCSSLFRLCLHDGELLWNSIFYLWVWITITVIFYTSSATQRHLRNKQLASLKKLFKNTTLSLLYRAWGDNDVARMKRGRSNT